MTIVTGGKNASIGKMWHHTFVSSLQNAKHGDIFN